MRDSSLSKKEGAERGGSLTVIESVVTAVADATSTSPMGLPPLAGVIDPDALESLVSEAADGPNGSSISIKFAYAGRVVVVDASGDVTVATLPDE